MMKWSEDLWWILKARERKKMQLFILYVGFYFILCVCIFQMCLVSVCFMGRRVSGQLLREANVSANSFMSDNNKRKLQMGILNMLLKPFQKKAEITFLSMHEYWPLYFCALMFHRRVCNKRATWLCLSTLPTLFQWNKKKCWVNIFELNHSVCAKSIFGQFPWHYRSSNKSTNKSGMDKIN